MKKIVASLICVIMCCTFLCQYVAAATTDTATFVPSSFMLYNFFGVPYNTTDEESYSYTNFVQDYTGFSFDYQGDEYPYYGCDFQILGNWTDTSFFNTTPYEKYYLTFAYDTGESLSGELVNGCLWLRVLDSSGNWVTYYDFDYAIVSYYTCTYSISDPDLIVPDNSSAFNCRCYFSDVYISANFDFRIKDISVTKTYSADSGGSSSGGSSSDSSSDTTTSGGSSGSGSGSSDADYTVIVNKLDKVGELLDDLAANDVKQINLLTTQNVLISQLPDKLRDMDVGEDYTGSIDTSDLAGFESDKAAVESMIDVGGVIEVFDDGISLDQSGLYNDQSFAAVGGLMSDFIEATGIMPLIVLSLSFGLIALVLNRPRG